VVVDAAQVPGIDTVLGIHEGQSPDTVETPPPVVMVLVLTTVEGEHELIVTVEAGNVAQVSPLIVSVMVLASKLLVPPP
jgi:hypothetical protein